MERFWIRNYEAGVPEELSVVEETVVEFLEGALRTFPDRPALTLKGKTLTYRQLQDQVERLSAGLARLGVERGARVALWLPNLPQTVIAYFAILRLGAVVVNTNPLYKPRELTKQFNDAGVTVVITLDYLWRDRLRPVLGSTCVQHVVVTSIPDYLPFPLKVLAPLKLRRSGQYVRVPAERNVHRFADLLAGGAAVPARVELGFDDLALLQYTGGTTGEAKGAMLTHGNISINTQQCAAWFPVTQAGSETLLASLPYFHVFGMTVSMLWPLRIGAHIVLAPDPRDIADLVRSIARYRVTLFPAVPAQFQKINAYPGIERIDVSSVKGCFSGSAPLKVDVLERFERLTGGKITEGFGMTETSPVTHANPLNGLRKPGSVGVPVPGTDMKVVDIESGLRELGIGEEGELCVRGPQVMKGYWGRPDETALTLRDGWVHTGDLARIDEDGYCFIVGRKKDVIVVGGYNVYPDEVDEVLCAHPAVAESATIGVPDERSGERVKSFVVLETGAATTRAEIRAYCREELAAYKIPRELEFVAELPKSGMMKILRRELRERELARRVAGSDVAAEA